MNNFRHLPIMPYEVKEHLIINKNGKYLDCTFGRGGHSKIILDSLEQKGQLTAIDKDHEAINSARLIQDERFEIHHSSILNFAKSLKKKVLMGYSWI